MSNVNRTLLSVKEFSKQYPSFPEGGIRWQIFNEETNGLKDARAIIRIGRKVLIDVDKYFSWIDTQQEHVA